MATELDDLLPKADDLMKKIAEAEAQKASEYGPAGESCRPRKKALLDQFLKPSGVSDEERQKRAADVIKRAVDKGLTEIQVITFPNVLCTDGGRAINQQEPGGRIHYRITKGAF